MADPSAPKGPYKPGNTAPDGSYVVGKSRTPEHGRFRVGDGRKRGRRLKGTANLDTDVAREASKKISLSEGKKRITVTKQQAVVMTMFDLAFKGNVPALREALTQIRSVGDRQAERRGRHLPEHDREIIDQYFDDLAKGLGDHGESPSPDDPNGAPPPNDHVDALVESDYNG